MLGRYTYRVHATGDSWTVSKEGERGPRAEFSNREEAVTEACRLAKTDQPSRVMIEVDGAITDEQLFGTDVIDELAIDRK
jgi:hypothetical protein